MDLGGGGRGMSGGSSSRDLVHPNILDTLGSNGVYAAGRSRSMDRGAGMMDDRGVMMDSRMESRMSGGGNVYSSSSGGGGRTTYDYEHYRATSVEYDRRDRGGSDPYARSDICSVFVKNVS